MSYNRNVQQCLGKTAYYTSIPTIAQFVLNEIIRDIKWVENFHQNNCKFLKTARNIIYQEFHDLDVKFVNAYSGLFVVMNLHKYLKEQKFESEFELFQMFLDNGVYVVPGQTLYFNEPGWFRVVFAPNAELQSGLTRLKRVLKSVK